MAKTTQPSSRSEAQPPIKVKPQQTKPRHADQAKAAKGKGKANIRCQTVNSVSAIHIYCSMPSGRQRSSSSTNEAYTNKQQLDEQRFSFQYYVTENEMLPTYGSYGDRTFAAKWLSRVTEKWHYGTFRNQSVSSNFARSPFR